MVIFMESLCTGRSGHNDTRSSPCKGRAAQRRGTSRKDAETQRENAKESKGGKEKASTALFFPLLLFLFLAFFPLRLGVFAGDSSSQ
jgi:ABC-type Na+ efflux pump permease subunit